MGFHYEIREKRNTGVLLPFVMTETEPKSRETIRIIQNVCDVYVIFKLMELSTLLPRKSVLKWPFLEWLRTAH